MANARPVVEAPSPVPFGIRESRETKCPDPRCRLQSTLRSHRGLSARSKAPRTRSGTRTPRVTPPAALAAGPPCASRRPAVCRRGATHRPFSRASRRADDRTTSKLKTRHEISRTTVLVVRSLPRTTAPVSVRGCEDSDDSDVDCETRGTGNERRFAAGTGKSFVQAPARRERIGFPNTI